jgi:hypothetical protein
MAIVPRYACYLGTMGEPSTSNIAHNYLYADHQDLQRKDTHAPLSNVGALAYHILLALPPEANDRP